MTDKKVWLITGGGRGMGVDIAKAALAAGHAVVASGRNPERVSAAIGAHDDLLAQVAPGGAVEVAVVVAGCHVVHSTTASAWLGVPASTPLSRVSHLPPAAG